MQQCANSNTDTSDDFQDESPVLGQLIVSGYDAKMAN